MAKKQKQAEVKEKATNPEARYERVMISLNEEELTDLGKLCDQRSKSAGVQVKRATLAHQLLVNGLKDALAKSK